jgi:predicted RNase H-like HicB family nuclease
MGNEYTIFLAWDGEAGVWFCTSEDIPGLILESNSVEALMERVKLAAPELLEMSGAESRNIRLTFKAERSVVVA